MKQIPQQLLRCLGTLPPEEIALIVTIGLVLGVFPIAWGPTALCTAAAALLRLNLPAIHLVNQMTTPLQIALLVPFGRAGHAILRHESWSIWNAASDAVAGWFCIGVPAGILLYAVLICSLRRPSNASL